MRDFDDAALELRLRGVLKERLGSLLLDISVNDLEHRRHVREMARRRRGWVTLGLVAVLILPVGAILMTGGRPPFLATVAPTPVATPVITTTPPTAGPSAGPSTGNGPIILPLGNGTKAIAIAADGSRTDLNLPIHSRSCPTYSPDGRSLAFLTRIGSSADAAEHLVVSNPDGSDQRVLWSGRFDDQTFHQVIWSRDSRSVAATHARSDAHPNIGDRLIVGHRDGSAATVLDWGIGEFPGTLAWSPDGEALAAVRWIDDSKLAIEIRRLDGGTPRLLVTAPDIRSIAWSPDGKTIAYTATSATDPSGKTDLYFVEVDGSDPVAIGVDSPGSEGFLAWSPDGSQLAVLVFDANAFNAGTFSTRLVDRQGGAIRRLGPFPIDGNLAFTWSPDSRSLLYTTGIDGKRGTGPRIVPIDGSPSRILEVGSGDFYTQCPLTWQAIAP
ncbi:MAG: hypothetical protein ABJC39_12460 [Chloroflexota bacterium]